MPSGLDPTLGSERGVALAPILGWISSGLMCLFLLLVILSCASEEKSKEAKRLAASPATESQVTTQQADQEQSATTRELAPTRTQPTSKKTISSAVEKEEPGVIQKPMVPTTGEVAGQPSVAEEFEENAFPPTVSDSAWHQDAWGENDCMRCHETGVGDSPEIVHQGMAAILEVAKCRSCHVLIPGEKPHLLAKAKAKKKLGEDNLFADFAFPPSIPASMSHKKAWQKDDCRLCHESGISGAPKIVHERVPDLALYSKCRTCHVQIRVLDAMKR